MCEFIIELRKDDTIAKQVLGRFALLVYQAKSKTLFRITRSKVKQYIVDEGKDYVKCVETGWCPEMRRRAAEFESFMESDRKGLGKTEAYRVVFHDRGFIASVRKVGMSAVAKASGLALGSGTVWDFFNCSGITVTWKVVVCGKDE